jgi:predicted dehydrogenase
MLQAAAGMGDTTMNEIRIGLAGLGFRGLWWLQLLQKIPGYRVVALCDRIAALHEKGLAALRNRRGVKLYTDYGKFLADKNVDAVALTVRCREQGALAARALQAGKHVNSEVPATHSIEDCWRIVIAAEKSGKVYQLAEQVRYAGFVEAWKNLVAQGRLGRVTYAEGQYIGYYGTRQFFQDPKTGEFCSVDELPAHPGAKPTWLHEMPPIHYVVHDISPLLKVMDDRVVEVVAMSTRRPSYSHPEIGQPDIQVALMKTANDAVLRLATGYTQPGPHDDHHWYQVIGTRGRVEWRRRPGDKPRMWLADSQMHEMSEIDWRFERTDAPAAASGSGHWNMDYYVHAHFRDAVLQNKRLDMDVYQAIETAAPGILAAESIEKGSQCLKVPDFRPGKSRAHGHLPKNL